MGRPQRLCRACSTQNTQQITPEERLFFATSCEEFSCFFSFPLASFSNRSRVDLQCCVSFCCTAKWFSYTYIYSFSYSFPLLLQEIEYSSLCYTVGPCCLSILYIVGCICWSHTPNLSLLHPLSPLVTISLFSMSVSLFLFRKKVHLCRILDSTYKWYHMVLFFLFLTHFT